MTASFVTLSQHRPIAPPDRAALRIGIIAGILMLMLAGLTRLGWPGVVEFKSDEAALSTMALDFVHGKGLPLLGIPSSVGLPNPPMSVYLMAIPYAIDASPVLATTFVGLLNVLAVLLLYLLAWRYYGLLAGIVAGVLYAANPWAVLYSRKIWEQNLLPVFAIALIACALIGLVEGKRWAQWWILPLLAICGQLHYGAFVLIPVTAYLIVVGVRRKTIRRGLFGGLIIALLLTAPYLIGLEKAGLFDPAHVRAALAAASAANPGQTKATFALTGDGFYTAGLVIGGGQIYSLAGNAYQGFLNSTGVVGSLAGSNTLPDLITLLTAIAAVYLILQTVITARAADPRRPIDIAALLWLLVTPLAFSLRWTPVYTHYYIIMLPGAFFVLGAAAGDLWRVLGRRQVWQRILGAVSGVSLIGVALIEAGIFIALIGFIDTHVTDSFGVPLHDLMPMRQRALDSGTPAVIAALDGQDMLVSPEATVWNALLAPIPERRFTDPHTTVYPLDRTPVFTQVCQGVTGEARLIAGDPTCFTLINRARAAFDFETYQPIVPTKVNPSVQFANGADLIGYRWQAADPGCLDLVWGVAESFVPNPNLPDYFFAVHFTDSHNREIANADGLSWRSRYWRPGDLIVRTFCLTDSSQVAQVTGVRLGMYTYDGQHFNNVNLIDAHGTPTNQIAQVYFSPMF